MECRIEWLPRDLTTKLQQFDKKWLTSDTMLQSSDKKDTAYEDYQSIANILRISPSETAPSNGSITLGLLQQWRRKTGRPSVTIRMLFTLLKFLDPDDRRVLDILKQIEDVVNKHGHSIKFAVVGILCDFFTAPESPAKLCFFLVSLFNLPESPVQSFFLCQHFTPNGQNAPSCDPLMGHDRVVQSKIWNRFCEEWL